MQKNNGEFDVSRTVVRAEKLEPALSCVGTHLLLRGQRGMSQEGRFDGADARRWGATTATSGGADGNRIGSAGFGTQPPSGALGRRSFLCSARMGRTSGTLD